MVRRKHRYITVEIDRLNVHQDISWDLKPMVLRKEIFCALQKFHGNFGVAVLQGYVLVKYCHKETKIAIIKCILGPHQLVASVLPFITTVDNTYVRIHTLYTGATLRHCYIFIKRYQLDRLRRMFNSLCRVDRDEYREYADKIMNLSTVENFNSRFSK